MRKQVFGRKLKRDANERKALLKGLMNDLVLKEKITTTHQKAQAIRGAVEKLITKAKTRGERAVSLLKPYLTPLAIEKVTNDLSQRFADRPGGYVRIVKLGNRFGDHASMSVIEWVEKTKATKETKETKATKGEEKNSSVITTKAKQSRAKKTVEKTKPVKKAEKKTK